jgi:hypothetical protein
VHLSKLYENAARVNEVRDERAIVLLSGRLYAGAGKSITPDPGRNVFIPGVGILDNHVEYEVLRPFLDVVVLKIEATIGELDESELGADVMDYAARASRPNGR